MAKKNNNDFSSQRDILNFRPSIRFIEPDQISEEDINSEETIPTNTPTLDDIKITSQDLIDSYKQLEDLANIAQAQIDERAKDLIIHLDSNQDATILDALKRHFNDPNKDTITYDDYKQCITDISKATEENFSEIDPVEIEQGASDPFRNTFGTIGKLPGLGRPELEKTTQAIKPLDMKSFKSNSLADLFDQLKPLITKLVLKKIKDPRP